VLAWAERARADGRIGHLGFSFHDTFDAFKQIVDGYDGWTLCQIQYNFMDVEVQAGTRGLKYAAERGLAVVIMEPLRGGRLAGKPPDEVARLWAKAERQRTHVDWALQWVWNQPEVSLLLSGMSAMAHVLENVASADRAGVGILTTDELALVDRVRQAYQGLCPIPCTRCKYCLPCPNGVNIPRILEIYNEAFMYGDEHAQIAYGWLKEEERGDQCAECGECEDVCPQSIAIAEWLEKAHALLCAEA
jgi:predicted aldo/keto reductase-like oxidoreductase